MTVTSKEAIHKFLSEIFRTAVPSGSVYSGAAKPELPYAACYFPMSLLFGEKAEGYIDYYYIDDQSLGTNAENALANFARRVGINGETLNFDGGRLYITRGEPFYKLTADKSDQSRKCVHIKLNISCIAPALGFTITDGSTSYIIDPRSEISVSSKLVGAKAESVSGKCIMDVIGTKTVVEIKTCWINKKVAAGMTRFIASSPVLSLSISDPFGSPDGTARKSDFMFDMPRIISQTYEPETGKEYVKLEINACEQGVQPAISAAAQSTQPEV